MTTTFRTRKKTPVAPFAKPSRSGGPDEADLFAESIRKILADECISRTDGSELKSRIVARVQDYSIELSFSGDGISELFLELCDLMLDGRLTKMPDDAFRVYLAVKAHGANADPDSQQCAESLAALSGLTDAAAVIEAIRHLRSEGYIHPPEGSLPPAKGRRRTEIDEEEPPDGPASAL